MKTGTLAHEVLERLDFKNPNLENIEEPLQSKIRKFLQTPIISNHQNANFYKEYEFIAKLPKEFEKFQGRKLWNILIN